ncbi:uncharacterized protein BDR25DRAFT_351817 [Lindgomyces ingoldianus]|uniref:Uncharacterized protein n=1 Tax=Lindgomyces ingoldianus TaxID=673940 RepID=A0ACB6R4N6_9PLEO|nr:uncharacterized protein BDR25DRAFT_351817 [Lindgomyces ingoldianus]KAF2474258.1 hypothetical protein BDR25DRAFT_351817 [Lindgomyces ingoldianus]
MSSCRSSAHRKTKCNVHLVSKFKLKRQRIRFCVSIKSSKISIRTPPALTLVNCCPSLALGCKSVQLQASAALPRNCKCRTCWTADHFTGMSRRKGGSRKWPGSLKRRKAGAFIGPPIRTVATRQATSKGTLGIPPNDFESSMTPSCDAKTASLISSDHPSFSDGPSVALKNAPSYEAFQNKILEAHGVARPLHFIRCASTPDMPAPFFNHDKVKSGHVRGLLVHKFHPVLYATCEHPQMISYLSIHGLRPGPPCITSLAQLGTGGYDTSGLKPRRLCVGSWSLHEAGEKGKRGLLFAWNYIYGVMPSLFVAYRSTTHTSGRSFHTPRRSFASKLRLKLHFQPSNPTSETMAFNQETVTQHKDAGKHGGTAAEMAAKQMGLGAFSKKIGEFVNKLIGKKQKEAADKKAAEGAVPGAAPGAAPGAPPAHPQ